MKSNRKIQEDICCANDPRSVAAMLRGTGDGREKEYARYAKKALARNPSLDSEDLRRMYEDDTWKLGYEDEVRLDRQRRAKVIMGRVGYHFIGVSAVYTILWIFLR